MNDDGNIRSDISGFSTTRSREKIYNVAPVQKLASAVLILARGGSKGVRLKNLQKVGGRTLIRNTVETARDAGIDDITVSTDHPLIALEALKPRRQDWNGEFLETGSFYIARKQLVNDGRFQND
ncbi:N-acylneuraminate cytidylyltransferase-like protein, partial [Operophtera brumata]